MPAARLRLTADEQAAVLGVTTNTLQRWHDTAPDTAPHLGPTAVRLRHVLAIDLAAQDLYSPDSSLAAVELRRAGSAPDGIGAALSWLKRDLESLLAVRHVFEARAQATNTALAAAFARGADMLEACVARTGGAWTAADATAQLGISMDTLQAWQAQRLILALDWPATYWRYPVVQFLRHGASGGRLTPDPAMRPLLEIADGHLTDSELFGILATPQPMLATDDGEPRTGFAAIAVGDLDPVHVMLRWLVTPADEGAPPAKTPLVAHGRRR